MNWKQIFIRDYAGHPLRVALNTFLVAATGVLVGHYLLHLELTPRLVLGALLPALAAILVAGWLKAEEN